MGSQSPIGSPYSKTGHVPGKVGSRGVFFPCSLAETPCGGTDLGKGSGGLVHRPQSPPCTRAQSPVVQGLSSPPFNQTMAVDAVNSSADGVQLWEYHCRCVHLTFIHSPNIY